MKHDRVPHARAALAIVVPLTTVLLLTSPVGAQANRFAGIAPPPSCMGPGGTMPRAASLLQLVPDDATPPFARLPERARRSADLTTELVARYIRSELGAADGALPALDSTRHSGDFMGSVTFIGHPDGSIRRILPWEAEPRPTRDNARKLYDRLGLQLLVRALDSLSANERFTWPEGVNGDSITFRLRYDWPRPDGAGHFDPIVARYAAPVAPLLVAAMREVRPARPVDFEFRRWPGGGDQDVDVTMEFVVDSTGRPLPSTIRDVWPANVPRPEGLAARSYAEFVRDLRRSLERARYIPARVGTCLVNMPVRQQFLFAYER